MNDETMDDETMDKPTLSDQDWQEASTVMALIRCGVNSVSRVAELMQRDVDAVSELIHKLVVLELVMWLDRQIYLTGKGLRSCRLIMLAKRGGGWQVEAVVDLGLVTVFVSHSNGLTSI